MNLRTKIPLIHSALFLGIGLCLLFWSVLISERLLIEEENDLFTELLLIAAANVSPALRDGDQGRLHELISALSSGDHHVRDALLLDTGGRILIHRDSSRHGERFVAPGRVFPVVELGRQATPSSGGWLSIEVLSRGRPLGTLMVSVNHDPLWARIAQGRQLIFALGFFTLLTSVPIAFYVARKISRPFESLLHHVNTTNPLNLGETLQLKSGDEIEQLATAFNDLSARLRENYHAVERAKYEWEQTFDSISDPLFIHDGECRIIRCNHAYAQVAGLSYADILGRPYYEIFPRQDGPLQACEPSAGARAMDVEPFLVAGNGRGYNIKMFPVELPQEGRVCVLCLCEDVTDAIHAQEDLRRSEESLKNAQRIAHIGNWDWDIRSGTLHWSDEIFRIFELEVDVTPSYESFMDMVHPDDRVNVRAAVEKALDGGEPYNVVHRILLPDGSVKYMHELGEVLFDNQGRALCISGTVHDITSRRLAEIEAHDLFIAALTSLVAALEAKSPWTKGHSDRVAEYAARTAVALGLEEEHVERIRIAALLHDIGKIGTSEAILDKVDRLTPEEYESIKMHPARGAEMLAPIRQLHGLISWIRSHHERWDGGGYPDHLRGEQIPLEARILAVADTFDSMTAERPYRRTPGFGPAREELQRCAGSQFDPVIVDAFVGMLDDAGTEPSRQASVPGQVGRA